MVRPAGGRAYAMTVAMWLPLLVKALATALIVISASVVAEALGPFWGAMIASLPVSAGPAYVFLSMQHGKDFVAASALSSCAANAATGLFLMVYGILARRALLWKSLGAAVLAWLAASLATQQIIWTPSTALVINVAVYSSGFLLLKANQGTGDPAVVSARRQWYELPVRAAAVAAFVSVVVAVSSALGPHAIGIAAVFPVSLISLIVIVRSRLGGPASSRLAIGALRPMLGFGIMLLALHLSIQPLGITAALSIAMSVSVLWSGALLVIKARDGSGQVVTPRERVGRCSPNWPASSVRKTADHFDQKIDEQACAQRKLTSERVQDENRRREHRALRQHDT